jgi:glycosyltransferase involved in cell wall biosynthesis
MPLPLISIIIPTRNSSQVLPECFFQLGIQTFRNFEVVIQDCLSTDQTLEMAENFSRQNPDLNINTESVQDGGIYQAMNRAVERSLGKWLFFLGDDDSLYDADVLQKISDAISAHPTVEMIYGNVIKRPAGVLYDGFFNKEKILLGNICHQAIFLRKDAFYAFGRFDLRFPACADWYLNILFFRSGRQHLFKDIVISNYHDEGFSKTFHDSAFFEYLHREQKQFYRNPINRMRHIIRKISGGRKAAASS